MKRREFMTLVGGAAAAWPLVARAQQKLPVVGLLGGGAASGYAPFLDAFRQGLSQTGHVEGQNVALEVHWANGQSDALTSLATDLSRNGVAVIATMGGSAAPVAAKAATSTIPIVFVIGGDPLRLGLVSSFNRPGGNVTGVSFVVNALSAKRLALLHELAPSATLIGFLVNPNNPNSESEIEDVQAAARALGLQVQVQGASSESDLDAAFAGFVDSHIQALLVQGEPLFVDQRRRVTSMAAQHGWASSYAIREFAEAGGLFSYGASQLDASRLAGTYVGRVLNGEKPGELPVQQPTKFDLVINIKTSKALGLTIPPTLLALADEVIE